MYSVVLNAMKVHLVIGAISFNGLQTEVVGWVSSGIMMILAYWVTKSFFGKSFGQMTVTALMGALAYFVVKNTDTVMNSLSGIFKSIFS